MCHILSPHIWIKRLIPEMKIYYTSALNSLELSTVKCWALINRTWQVTNSMQDQSTSQKNMDVQNK